MADGYLISLLRENSGVYVNSDCSDGEDFDDTLISNVKREENGMRLFPGDVQSKKMSQPDWIASHLSTTANVPCSVDGPSPCRRGHISSESACLRTVIRPQPSSTGERIRVYLEVSDKDNPAFVPLDRTISSDTKFAASSDVNTTTTTTPRGNGQPRAAQLSSLLATASSAWHKLSATWTSPQRQSSPDAMPLRSFFRTRSINGRESTVLPNSRPCSNHGEECACQPEAQLPTYSRRPVVPNSNDSTAASGAKDEWSCSRETSFYSCYTLPTDPASTNKPPPTSTDPDAPLSEGKLLFPPSQRSNRIDLPPAEYPPPEPPPRTLVADVEPEDALAILPRVAMVEPSGCLHSIWNRGPSSSTGPPSTPSLAVRCQRVAQALPLYLSNRLARAGLPERPLVSIYRKALPARWTEKTRNAAELQRRYRRLCASIANVFHSVSQLDYEDSMVAQPTDFDGWSDTVSFIQTLHAGGGLAPLPFETAQWILIAALCLERRILKIEESLSAQDRSKRRMKKRFCVMGCPEIVEAEPKTCLAVLRRFLVFCFVGWSWVEDLELKSGQVARSLRHAAEALQWDLPSAAVKEIPAKLEPDVFNLMVSIDYQLLMNAEEMVDLAERLCQEAAGVLQASLRPPPCNLRLECSPRAIDEKWI